MSNPSDAQNYVNVATLACEHLNYNLAVQTLTSGIKRIPNSHELILSRGIVLTLKAQSPSRSMTMSVLSKWPLTTQVYPAFGLSRLEAGELDDAVKTFEEALRREPKEPRPYLFLAEALIQKGVTPGTAAFDQARRVTDTAISLDPDFAFAYFDRAKLELEAKETDKAIADLEHARAANPKSTSITYLLAQAYQRNGEEKKADALFARVRESSDRGAREFRRNSLTDALVAISKGHH